MNPLASKYILVSNDLAARIQSGMYPAGSRMPAESQLIREYGVSRDTLRKALAVLEQEGYIQKARGREALVLDREKVVFPVSGLTSFQELAEAEGYHTRTEVVLLESVRGSRELMKALDLTRDEEAWRLYRVREIEGERVILDKDFLSRKYVPRLQEENCTGSLYKYLEEELGLKIGCAQKEITACRPSEEDRRYLDLGKNDIVIAVRSYVYLENGALFQHTESRHRWDRFRFVDFARRVRV